MSRAYYRLDKVAIGYVHDDEESLVLRGELIGSSVQVPERVVALAESHGIESLYVVTRTEDGDKMHGPFLIAEADRGEKQGVLARWRVKSRKDEADRERIREFLEAGTRNRRLPTQEGQE